MARKRSMASYRKKLGQDMRSANKCDDEVAVGFGRYSAGKMFIALYAAMVFFIFVANIAVANSNEPVTIVRPESIPSFYLPAPPSEANTDKYLENNREYAIFNFWRATPACRERGLVLATTKEAGALIEHSETNLGWPTGKRYWVVDQNGKGATLDLAASMIYSGGDYNTKRLPLCVSRKNITAAGYFLKVRKNATDSELAPGKYIVAQQGGHEILELSNSGGIQATVFIKGAVWLARPFRGGIVGIVTPRNQLESGDEQTVYHINEGGEYVFNPGRLKEAVRKYFLGQNLDTLNHDILPAKDGTYFVLAKIRTEYAGHLSFLDFIVQFDKQYDILWTWDVAMNLLGHPPSWLGDRTEHWIHSNSLDFDLNGNIVLSARNLSQIVVIEYPGGAILKRFGQDVLDEQHHVTVQANGDFLAFNNHYMSKHSSVVRFNSAGNLLFEKPLYDADGKTIFTEAYGSVQQMENGNYVVCDGKNGRVLEYDSTIERVLMQIELNQQNYVYWDTWGSEYQKACYRVYKIR